MKKVAILDPKAQKTKVLYFNKSLGKKLFLKTATI